MPHPEETTIWPGHDYGETPAREMGENIHITPRLSGSRFRVEDT